MRSVPRIFPLLVLCLALAGFTSADEVEQVFPDIDPEEVAPAETAAVNETPQLWFVELGSAPIADGGSAGTLRAEKNAFRAAAAKAGISFQERYSFDTLFNGLSIRIAHSDIARLSRLDGVKAIWPVVQESLPEPRDINRGDLATALAMTGADIAQSSLGYTGAGIRVAIVDSGVDYDHPDLGGCFGPGCRVAYGYDFVGDAYTSGLTPVPDALPDDCGGHGSHVAGIVGANGALKGVAPNVTFGAYRVFGCSGTTDTDIMIAAMERALADGMQVLNMSIGSSFQWPEYPSAAAATRLVNRGVVVVCSIGNSGASGLYAASAPGVGDKVIGVASFNNTHVTSLAFSITPDGKLIGYNQATASPTAPLSGTYAMARTGTSASTADGCAPLPAGSLAGKVALIRRGTCGFNAKAFNAQNAGAAGVVLYNNVAGALNPTVAGPPTITIPVVAITQADGNLIDARLAAGAVSLTWTDSVVSASAGATGGLISSFSSWGLSPDLNLKPDIGAPGGNIFSTVPLEQGAYGLNSGTSMASPHVAGAAALLLEARPHTPSQAMSTLLLNSASPRLWSGNPALGFLDLVHRQGAGMLQIDRAILSSTKISPAKLSLGESDAGPAVRTLTVTNDSASDVTYNITHSPALATGPNTFAVSFFNAPASVAFSAPSVTVPANGSASVDVTISPNAGLANRSIYGGYVVFTPTAGGQTYRVPYAGFKGDYQSYQVLVPTTNNFPRVCRQVSLTGTFSFLPAGTGGTWLMNAFNEIPNLCVHLDHQSRRIDVEVTEAGSGKSWHRAMRLEHVGRNSGATSFFALPWDGETIAGRKIYTVPNGQYVLKVTVTKALGTDGDPAHTETWTSPVITLARP
ncbi:MAG TPA: S8 family serine peptidase [Thermoanaerobaculia bacterium]|nr:S8 family serine peptidase [Thermoanaerobaculia bacterium]